MDPLSLTTSIIAILELTATLTSYINDVRHATREQAKVAVEASNLYSLLTSLRFRVEEARSDDLWFNQVKLLASENGPLDQFKYILENMVEKTSSSRKRDKIKSAMVWKFTKSEVENALRQMERLKSLIQCALTEDLFTLSQAIRGDVVTLGERTEQLHRRTERLQTHAGQELQHRLARWLGVPDPSVNYHTALEKRHPETGQWFLSGQDFDDWRSSMSSLMWLHGNAGCGKTILSAATLQNIIQLKEARPEIVIARQVHDGIQVLEQLYCKCENGQQHPAENVIRSLLRDFIDPIESIYIILDALDECTDREDLLTLVHDLIRFKRQGLHVLATSRRERDIEEHLSPIANYNINIQSAVVDQDIRVYVRDRLTTDPKLKKWPRSVQDEISIVMMEKAGGMFRWAYCQLESIRQCIKLSALRKALSSLPKTLDETYGRILQSLKASDQLQDAIKVLRWLCFSNRPLRLSEICEVFAIENGDNGGFFPEEGLPNPADIMVVCSSLISCSAVVDDVDDKEDIIDSAFGDEGAREGHMNQIQLAHFSVKEYLLSDRCAVRSEFQMQACHGVIAEGCLRYFLHLGRLAPLTTDVVDQHPLARYAAEYWWWHIQEVDYMHNGRLFILASRLLKDKNAALLSWVQLYNTDMWWKNSNLSLTPNEVAQPLYYAASLGVSEVVQSILSPATEINAQGGEYGYALEAASWRGHEKVVQILLDAGAEVNAQGGRYGNALQAASVRGHEKVLQILLDAGAEINAQGGEYGNALQAASIRGHEKVVQILLDAEAGLNAQGGRYGNALQAASYGGHEKVVQILLDAKIEINAQGGEYGYALQAASRCGHEKVVQILLDAGAEVNAQGGRYGNALQAASIGGHRKVVRILLDAGAEVNAQGGHYGNALQAASVGGHEKVVQILLDTGTKVNAQGGRYGNALQAASICGYEKVVQILLDAGAELNAQGGEYGNALQAASRGGHEKAVQILLDAGAEVNAQGGHYGNALQAASNHGHEKVVQILLDARAEVNAQGGHYGNALQAASYDGHEKVVRILLDAGADVNAQARHYGNALQAASNDGFEKVVQMLLAAGAEVNAQVGFYSNALQAASRGGHEKVVQILLDAGAEVNAQGGWHGNALRAASYGGHKKMVQMLLDAGAMVNTEEGEYDNTLQAASTSGHEKVVQILYGAVAEEVVNGNPL